MEKLILASGSPRRRELLALAGFDFEVIVSEVEERVDSSLSPEELVISLAEQKAAAVALSYPERTVIGADTVVALGDKILGKPQDEENAAEMLRALSGKIHNVFTGVCIFENSKSRCFFEKTQVEFYPLSNEEIAEYIASGEPMDKAGAYGIQGRGCVLIKGISGDYFNVVGFPVSKFCREIKKNA